jgi:hypothetical protein
MPKPPSRYRPGRKSHATPPRHRRPIYVDLIMPNYCHLRIVVITVDHRRHGQVTSTSTVILPLTGDAKDDTYKMSLVVSCHAPMHVRTD